MTDTHAEDTEHLRLISLGYYVSAAINGVFALFPVGHVVMGFHLAMHPESFHSKSGPPPHWFGWLFFGVGLAMMLIFASLAGVQVLAGRCIARRTSYTFCVAIAALSLFNMPVGMLAGAFTLVLLLRPSMRTLFGRVPT